MKRSIKLTAKNKCVFIITGIVLLLISMAIYIPVRMRLSKEDMDYLNNTVIMMLLIVSLITRIYPSENTAFNLDILTIAFTTVISFNLVDLKKMDTFTIITLILSFLLPFLFSYISVNLSVDTQKSNMINYMNTYKKGGFKPDTESAEYKKLHSAYNIISDYIIIVDNAIRNYNGDNDSILVSIENKDHELKLKIRFNAFLRYYLEKGYDAKLVADNSGTSKIKITW